MKADATPVDLSAANIRLGAGATPVMTGALVVGAVSLVAGFLLAILGGPDKLQSFMHSYLSCFGYFLAPTVGAIFFVMIQHQVRAHWNVSVRRIAEIIGCNVALMALFAAPIVVYTWMGKTTASTAAHAEAGHETAAAAKPLLVKAGGLYSWTNGDLVEHDHALKGKKPYLNFGFFVARTLIYFILWGVLANFFHGKSLEQETGNARACTSVMEVRSAPAIFAFALTYTFAAFDYFMSLDPHWYSTIFGVYVFAGGQMSFFAILILTLMILQKNGLLKGVVTVEHYHDLGKFLFGFMFFWGYIGFSQYMLIWYSNIPEETAFIRDRQFASDGVYGPWTYVSLLLLFVHFLIPFPLLVSRRAKRNLSVLAFWAIWLLAAHAVDWYWIVMPNLSRAQGTQGRIPLDPSLVLCFIGMGGLLIWNFVRMARNVSLVAVGDPRLKESLALKNF